MKKLFFLSFFLIQIIIIAQTPVPIAEIRVNNSNGVPVDTGQVFTITGVVTSGNHFGSFGPGSIEDLTAGMSVYGSSFASNVQTGDSVTVTGVLTEFRGLTQIDARRTGYSFINHGPVTPIEPEIVTLLEIKNQQWNGFEEYESRLVRVNNITITGAGNFASGTNYTINDGTTTLELRIDNDVTSIINTPIPSGEVDIIGIVGQFKTSAPFNSGYQLLPRFILDIVDDGSPLILNPVVASNIDTSSFVIYFQTARNGNSQVKYGLTPALELDSVVYQTDTIYHVVPVTGLQPATKYYFKAYSTNAAGTSESALLTATTSSADPTLGTINVYFNFPVDTTVAIPGNAAQGNVDFRNKLISRINSATHSIDLALYSFFGLPDVADAIIAAKNRGVKIRVVYDNRTTQNSMQQLINAGVPIIKRHSDINGIMHNKFLIFDARDEEPANDWVWTGSWNVTSTELSWKNNVIEINDPTLAAAFKIEFEEMWGSNTDIPNSSNAKFGIQKTDNTPHFFNIGGKEVQLYFSPSDNTNQKIIEMLNTADHNIYFSTYVFTRADLQHTLWTRFNSGGVSDIRGIIDAINSQGSQWSNLTQFAEMFHHNVSGTILHHKYAMVDATHYESNPTLLTGSHNWSNAAENDNDENTLIVHDVYIANLYMQEFKRRYNELGGTGTFIVPIVGIEDLSIAEMNHFLYQNYPNPFNPVTTIRFEVPEFQYVTLELFDVLGRKVKTLFEGDVAPGIVSVDFNAGDLSSGIYIYRLKSNDFMASKKLMLMK